MVRATRPADLLWAMEEGLRTPGIGAVLGEIRQLDLTASRRLQLAAESGGGVGLVLSPVETAGSTVAVTVQTLESYFTRSAPERSAGRFSYTP